MTVVIELDRELDAAYVRLTEGPVVRTIEYSESVLVDLDQFDVVVGVEVLDVRQPLPFDELTRRFHVREEVVALLRQIQPSVSTFIDNVSQGSGGTTPPSTAKQLSGR